MAQSKPNSEEEVYECMKQYCVKKQYRYADSKLKYLAEDCYLFWESRGWKDCKFWPALAMRWVLNDLSKCKEPAPKPKPKPDPNHKTVRDIILEREKDNEL